MNATRPLLWLGLLLLGASTGAQEIENHSASTQPVKGLRQAVASPSLLTGAMVVTSPGRAAERLDILIDNGMIQRVAGEVKVPAGTRRYDVAGKTIYAGLIDSYHDVVLENEPKSGDSTSTAQYWNTNISPQLRAASVAGRDLGDEAKRRGQGITSVLIAPANGIVKGTSCLVLMVKPDDPRRLLRGDVFGHATLTVPRSDQRDSYPDSPMGATSLLRQSIYDARWHQQSLRISQNQTGVAGPPPDQVLEQLAEMIESRRIVFDAANERMAVRAADVSAEFSLAAIIRGSGREYRDIDQIAASGLSILLPVNFADKPDASTIESIAQTPLVDWMHWHFAPTNPSRLDDAGVRFAFTTDGLDDAKDFLKNIRLAVQRGLDRDVALAALTTTPAQWMGVDNVLGKVQAGSMANLVVTDGDLFDAKTKVCETWVAGQRFEVITDKATDVDLSIGTWQTKMPTKKKSVPATVMLTNKDGKFSGSIQVDAPEQGDDEAKPKKAVLKNVTIVGSELSAMVRLDALGEDFASGVSQLSWLAINDGQGKQTRVVTLRTPDGVTQKLKLKPYKKDNNASNSDDESKESDEKTSDDAGNHSDAGNDSDTDVDTGEGGDEKVDENTQSKLDGDLKVAADAIPLTYPLGAFGRIADDDQESSSPSATIILFRGATVWTCSDAGVIENCDVLVRDGKIAELGVDLPLPDGGLLVDAAGKHLSPGLIDCHSHIATDGGINESGQVVTAEVRIGDFIDNTDIAIYRQLAGGVTTANILHGSANPIGGQSQTIKLRWGQSMRAMKFADAPAGIKFALGENVKRNGRRYPNTRMGVEQILRDQFLAARQYDAARRSAASGGLPIRRDLQLDALAEVQRGDRWVHCHSYRQDEIVATLDVLEEFNVQIGTLQHILEGYKVADRIANHGAMASSFADWWAYKFEVYDAIPYNGVLMHNAGVVVSFNSDDAELGRHLNTEAAKASKYGGVRETEALKFVTLNPAKQLRIDHRVGSIEVGKDADLVVWSGRPLSTTTRCEQTWVDGQPYFSLQRDQQLRRRDQITKAKLVQLALDDEAETDPGQNEKIQTAKDDDADVPEDQRWLRYDEFCNARVYKQQQQTTGH